MLDVRRAALLLLAFAGAGASTGVAAPPDRWSIDVGTEPSSVDISNRRETWWTNRIQATYREAGVGGLWLAGETQRRESIHDEVISAGAFRQLGDWTLSGQAAFTTDRDFLPDYALEAMVSRKLSGPFVVQAGYQYRSFPDSEIKIGSLAGFYYFGNFEIEARVDYGKNEPVDRPIRMYRLRATWDDGFVFSFGGGVAAGENLYDAINVPGVGGNRGWLVNANARYRLDARNSVRLDLFVGHEDPGFRQRTLGLSYRTTF